MTGHLAAQDGDNFSTCQAAVISDQGDTNGNHPCKLVEIACSFFASFEWKIDNIFRTYLRPGGQGHLGRKGPGPCTVVHHAHLGMPARSFT